MTFGFLKYLSSYFSDELCYTYWVYVSDSSLSDLVSDNYILSTNSTNFTWQMIYYVLQLRILLKT